MTRVTDEDLADVVACYAVGSEEEDNRVLDVIAELLALRKVADAAVKFRNAESYPDIDKACRELFDALKGGGL